MATVDCVGRGLSNIDDARFIRDQVVPLALQHERWGVAIHQAHQCLELLLKGMVCLTGRAPRKTHSAKVVLDQLLATVSPMPSNNTRLPFTIFAASACGHGGYGVWFQNDAGMVFNVAHGDYSLLGGFSIAKPWRADVLLRMSIQVERCIVRVLSAGKELFCVSNATFDAPTRIKREFALAPSSANLNRLKRLGRRLRDHRESAFYAERLYTKAEADKAIQRLDEANEVAACFLVTDGK